MRVSWFAEPPRRTAFGDPPFRSRRPEAVLARSINTSTSLCWSSFLRVGRNRKTRRSRRRAGCCLGRLNSPRHLDARTPDPKGDGARASVAWRGRYRDAFIWSGGDAEPGVRIPRRRDASARRQLTWRLGQGRSSIVLPFGLGAPELVIDPTGRTSGQIGENNG